jgi:malto-oligosyltrehalose synthase/4-alpha-glucanotransferase
MYRFSDVFLKSTVMYNPLSTYRIQFNKDFTFKDFKDHIEYFSLLGIKTIYASPVFRSTPGSIHGYDVTDPHILNPEIGNEQEFDEITGELKKKNIGWMQDIVPNHMAMHVDNIWLMDVLKRGKNSRYSNYFDIDFSHPDFSRKFIIPFLGKAPKEAIKDGEIKLDLRDNRLGFVYYDFFFPVKEQTEREIFEINEVRDKNKILEEINSDFLRLEQLLGKQHYLLSHWQEASGHLNYRRFFTINSLISLKMEYDKVFDDYHSYISDLISKEKIQGLRIDHIDGLKLPERYIEKLRVLAGDSTYIVAEKILKLNEFLPPELPLEGTTGYDFLGIVNNLFTYQKNYPLLRKFYQEFTGVIEQPEEIIYRKKKHILLTSMKGDLDNLCRLFEKDIIKDETIISSETIREVITELLVYFPRYKSYSWFFPLSLEDKNIIRKTITKAIDRTPSLKKGLKIFLNLFTDQEELTEEKKIASMEFFLRFMQFTGPLMAKGVEDTVMYYYNCFIAHNEVGDAVDSTGITINEFHLLMQKRLKNYPLTQNTTSTHDTKRGEDARARLNVISEFPLEWIKLVKKWNELNSLLKITINEKIVPSLNEEYFIYQTLAGIYPNDGEIDETFITRIEDYLVKALREAKVSSDWNEPDEEYEKSVINFTRRILEKGSDFLKSFVPFHKKLSLFGMYNSLVQLVLKSTCPGVPDFYQGTELWDFSLVDPDNRRPVNYFERTQILNKLIKKQKDEPEEFYKDVTQEFGRGYMKLWMMHILLKERSLHPQLFIHGLYIPVQVTGQLKENVLSFARVYKNTWYVMVVPLYTGLLLEKHGNSLGFNSINWQDTAIEIPALAPEKWWIALEKDVITAKGKILLSTIMKRPFPCILKGTKETTTRSAGILLHVSSLPGEFGTGDLGKQAYSFADYLWESGQTFWQILPINPVEQGSDYSPYSISSAFADNLLFIDPFHLTKLRLINEENLKTNEFYETNRTDFKKAEQYRLLKLEEAYRNYKNHPRPYLEKKFEEFCIQEKGWINDYALYVSIKKEYKGKSWVEWPEELRSREGNALEIYGEKNLNEIEKYKFWQFLFSMQWKSLREYVNRKGIKLIGDIPFYVNYDSVEVWQNPEIFKLDQEKKMAGKAGVPPDYFSETGQLWNMPVYNWEYMKKNDFSWWRNRIRKNLLNFDMVRLDHFRGFSSFWEVPPEEKTAVKGKWISSLGYELFKLLSVEFPNFPFIAEDLGDIDEEVYKLRDFFHFPGLEVLQFAFDQNMRRSVHSPFNHRKNSLVYTGTHDNNTIRGWFKNEVTSENKLLINDYLNKSLKISSVNEDFIRMCYNSVAYIAIVPMQDVLGLDSDSRLNNPALSKNNWTWKLRSKDLDYEKAEQLRKLVKLYGRI